MSDPTRLSQLSSRTLTLALERQRLAAFSPGGTLPSTQLSSITRNLTQLRAGILDQEEIDPDSVKSLRQQWTRIRMILGPEASDIDDLPPAPLPLGPPQPKSPLLTTYSGGDPINTPYSDHPERQEHDPHEMIGMQHQMMAEQDNHLDVLSQSINRQRDISIHIGSELEVHEGLLEDLDRNLDRTSGRMTGARRRLDQVARGTKDNASTVTIGMLIFILLILIVIFKT